MGTSVRDLWWGSYSLNLTDIGSLLARKRQHERSWNWRVATSTRPGIQLFFVPILRRRRNEQIGQSPRRTKKNWSALADDFRTYLPTDLAPEIGVQRFPSLLRMVRGATTHRTISQQPPYPRPS